MKQTIVGIDLGTSNTVVAYVEAGADEISIFDIDQLVGLGEVGARALLPSVRYHPAPGELAPGDLQLPWSGANKHETPPAVIGHLARTLGVQVPGRLVTSAKSWLSPAIWLTCVPRGTTAFRTRCSKIRT
jgi:molecular chaperone DnaK (HSP70)